MFKKIRGYGRASINSQVIMHIAQRFCAKNLSAAEYHCRAISRAASWHEDADFGGCWRHGNLIWLSIKCWSAAVLPTGVWGWSRSVPPCCPHLSPHGQTPRAQALCEIHNPVHSCLLWRGAPTFLALEKMRLTWHHVASSKSQMVCVKKVQKKTILEKSRSRVLSLLGKGTATRRQDNCHQSMF